jgi:hypothetical protein
MPMRGQFISLLAASGVHPKVAQVLARHSTITLTMDYYTHLDVLDVAGALEKLPDLSPSATSKPIGVAIDTNLQPNEEKDRCPA